MSSVGSSGLDQLGPSPRAMRRGKGVPFPPHNYGTRQGWGEVRRAANSHAPGHQRLPSMPTFNLPPYEEDTPT